LIFASRNHLESRYLIEIDGFIYIMREKNLNQCNSFNM